VSMFVDMRGSTQMAADQLPFDTVFIVNRFLGAISQAVIRAGGNVNQFLGDGLLALFGVDTDPQSACRQALKAAAMVAKNIEHLNQQLAVTERNVIRFGIGINGGEVIIGDVGHGENIAFTALGDAVNVAARLQDMSKELECEVVISDEVYQTAGLPLEELQRKEITVRGRTAPIVVRTVLKAENLATLFERTTAGSVAAPRRRTVRENL
jgi:adenylate cyclase